jgi:hypothetical protein
MRRIMCLSLVVIEVSEGVIHVGGVGVEVRAKDAQSLQSRSYPNRHATRSLVGFAVRTGSHNEPYQDLHGGKAG